MPYIDIKLSKSCTKEELIHLMKSLAEKITIIGGKKPEEVMTSVQADCIIQMGGEVLENGAFVNMSCFGEAPAEDNKAYALALFQTLKDLIGVEKDDIYMNLTERSWWGCHGDVIRL